MAPISAICIATSKTNRISGTHFTRSIECLVELSKIYEHHLKDLDLALAYARRALQSLMELRPLIWNFQEERAALLHRVKRIEEKCARRGAHNKEALESF